MQKLIGLIPAAGKGTRARPYTELIPKGMLPVNGKPNIERIICLMRDTLGIDEIYIVIGYHGSVIREYFKDGSQLGVTLHYIMNTDLDRGLAWSILLGGKHIHSPCCVILSDECYVNTNHAQLLETVHTDNIATCTAMEVDDPQVIRKNYSIEHRDGTILKLIEKPESPTNNLLGCGTFLLSPDIFPLLKDAFSKSTNNYVEFITFLDELSQRHSVGLFLLEGKYVNINDRDSLNLSKYYERNNAFSNNEINLLIYSEGIEEEIVYTIKQYRKHSWINHIYVILPHDSTLEAVIARQNITIIRCPQGLDLYGEKLRYALDRLPGDIYVVTEAAYTFPARDLDKLLDYLKEADMVVGTRTTRQLIQLNSHMKGMTRAANVLLAKLLEVLWWNFEGRFTDVGCTFRAIWASSYDMINEQLQSSGPEFLAEMTIEMLERRMKIIEIPVNYYNRNKAMNSRYRNIRTFFRIFLLIIRKRFFTKRTVNIYAGNN